MRYNILVRNHIYAAVHKTVIYRYMRIHLPEIFRVRKFALFLNALS